MKKLSVMNRAVLTLLLTGIVALATVAQSDVSKVNSIRLEKDPTSAKFIIEQSGTADFQDFLLSNPSRLVVDFVGARHGLDESFIKGDGQHVTSVRTSQFTNDPDEVTRIVFDLVDGTKYRVAKMGSSVEVRFFQEGTSQPAEKPVAQQMKASFGSSWDPETTEIQPKIDRTTESAWAKPVSTSAAGQQSWSTPAMKPSQTITTPVAHDVQVAQQTYVPQATAFGAASSLTANKDITLDIQGADMKTVLRSIAEFSGANIVAGPDVEGPVTVHLIDVAWREALDIVLKANGYGIREEYGIIRVQSLDRLHDEEIAIATVSKQKEELEPLVSRVIKLNYANAKEMKDAMKSATSKRGTVEVEKGNNAVIINDIPKIVDSIAEMVIGLDTRTNQVEIVAKMVDVDAEATREMGVKWDLLNVMSADVNANGDLRTGKDVSDPFGILRVGTVRSWGDVVATVEALEKDNKANIISNPRITTTDNKEANILVGKEIPLIVTDEAGNPITELKKVGITLRVTPHVNSDQTITMDLHPEISELSAQATVQGGVIISLAEADTRVVVRDGETAVIGGLINEVESKIVNGLPVLKDVPVLGGLFRFENTTKKKRELIIFVTPRIIGGIDGQDMSVR